MPKQKPTREEVLQEAGSIARSHGMYIVPRVEQRRSQQVLMYLLFRRLQFASHGTMIGKHNSPDGLLKLVKKAAGII